MYPATLLVVCSLALVGDRDLGEPEPRSSDAATIIGTPKAIDVRPREITLTGTRSAQQLIVTGQYAGGVLRDLTRYCQWKVIEPGLIQVSANGVVTARSDGETLLEVRVADLRTRVKVAVAHSRRSFPVSFRHEVMPVLSSAGCSDIRCHGAPSGKSGFRLSLWGSDPSVDYEQLTRGAFGRRTNSMAPDTSLIMNKALARVSHVGGQRFTPDGRFAKLLLDWQRQGVRDDQPIRIRSLEVVPAMRILYAPGKQQQLAVRAIFEDGRASDVTGLTTFSSSDLAIAEVDRSGLVGFKRQGEVAVLCRFLDKMVSVRLTHIASPSPDYHWPDPPENNFVDRHVFAKLKLLNLTPSELCGDEQFVRRLYLDLCGVLPSPTQLRTFVDSPEPDKRDRLVDRLLQRPEFADYWTKKWMDVLRVSRDSIQLKGATAFQHWMREQISSDRSFAEVADALLTAVGESYKDPAANFFCVVPTPTEVVDAGYLQKDLAEATAQLFFGIRLQCAQCHNHPFERWTQDDYLGLAAFFTQVKRDRLGKAGPKGRPDRRQIAITLDFTASELASPATSKPIAPHFPGEPAVEIPKQRDRREWLGEWLTQRDNPYFAKAIVNRVWFHLNGRGIVDPVDDFRDSNPSSNDALLDALAESFVSSGFRLKPLIRVIARSRTYQLSSQPNHFNRNDLRYFSHMFARPLPAEVLLDAICDVTGVPEKYEIMKDYIVGVPTESVSLRRGTRAVQLPVTDIVTLINTSGKYVRYELHPFLRTFGQPNRTQTCECDRQQNFSRNQALELSVGSLVADKLSQPGNRLGGLLAQRISDREILDELYHRALSRSPGESAAEALLRHVSESADRRAAWEDLLWTILNSQEFIYQH